MRATFALGGGGELESDPALEPSEAGGHTLLQRRLSLYGKVLVVQSILYWLIYAIIWGPTVGFSQSLRHIVSWDVVLLTAIYSLYWLVARGSARSARLLLATDVLGSLAIGIDNVFLMLGDLGTISGVFENLIGFICILLLRALIVPSTVKRTLLCGLLMCGPSILGVAFGSHRFDDQSLSWITMVGFSINWSVIALIFSGVASATLYGLRREVRDARKLGQYTLGEKLGEGGMGVVYRARHAMLRRPTAIKLLANGGEGSLVRFEQEVHLLASLNHPNIVTVHDYGRTADGSFYYAMELLDGMDLEKLVAESGPQPAERVIHIVRQVARGLREAHEVGLVHRDIKPANIFLCRRWGEPDAVKVLDFGLAKNNAEPPSSVTARDVVLGTPLYISPEALKSAALVDARSDIYSLGAVAYYMLTGEPVFKGNSAVEVCAQHLLSAPVVPSERLGRAVPADLEAIVLCCLAKSSEERYSTAAERSRARGLRCRRRVERRASAGLVAVAGGCAHARTRGRCQGENRRDRSRGALGGYRERGSKGWKTLAMSPRTRLPKKTRGVQPNAALKAR
jgi:eukaryotic-like serine/threonine-protein kinase